MSRDVFITGLGLVTPLGDHVEKIWSAILSGQAVATHARAAGSPDTPDRIHAIAAIAAEQAIQQAHASDARTTQPNRTALIVGTSKGAIETYLTTPPGRENKIAVSLAQPNGLASIAMSLQATFPLLDGPAMTLSAACASGLHALIRGAMMIQNHQADRVLVIAAEASVHPLFLASFRRLGVLARNACRPFDVNRDGFLMTEAAAAVYLENKPRPDARLPKIDRFALAGDATHITAADPNGAALKHVLETISADRSVDVIHAHGTGTIANDPIELNAIEAACDRESPVHIYSHKGTLGHSLGASGLVSIVLNCLMHRDAIVPGNVQTQSPIHTQRTKIAANIARQPIQRSIAIATGFGGAIAGVSLISL